VGGGTAILTNVTLSSNRAEGSPGIAEYPVGLGFPFIVPGGNAYGGGLYVGAGTVGLSNVTISGNLAQGGAGGAASYGPSVISPPARGTNGGSGYGGGLYVSAGSVSVTNVSISSNTAQGGNGAAGANGGSGFGGGLDAAGGTISLVHDTVTNNVAVGGQGGKGVGGKNGFPSGTAGTAAGGGLYISSLASLTLDAFTLANVNHNKPDDIFGSYTVSP
jgi:hypothetical protein